MPPIASPRAGAATLRTMCIVAALLCRVNRALLSTRARRLRPPARLPPLSSRPASGPPDHHAPPPARCAGAHDRIGHGPSSAIERATICLLNRERTERGLPRLRRSRLLIRSAQHWTNTMVRDRAFSHGSDFSARITAVGFNWSRAGENIADGYRTASGAVTAWMRSLGHCQNILTPVFREAGAGFDRGTAIGRRRRRARGRSTSRSACSQARTVGELEAGGGLPLPALEPEGSVAGRDRRGLRPLRPARRYRKGRRCRAGTTRRRARPGIRSRRR